MANQRVRLPEPRQAPPASRVATVPTERSPSETVLLTGAVVVGGVLLLSWIQSQGGLQRLLPTLRPTQPKPPTTPARPATTTTTPPVPLPSQPGLTFRSGSVGGMIPLPFDRLFEGIFSIFQPRPGQVPAPASPVEPRPPAAQQMWTLPQQTAPEEFLRPDGTVYTPPDLYEAGQQFYEGGGAAVPLSDVLRERLSESEVVPELPPFDEAQFEEEFVTDFFGV